MRAMKQLVNHKIRIALAVPIIICFFCNCKSSVSCRDVFNNYPGLTERVRTRDDSILFLNKLNKIIAEIPRCMKALQARADLLMEFRQFDFAKNDLLRAVDIDTTNEYSLCRLAVAYYFLEKPDSAIIFINKAATAKNPNGTVLNINPDFSNNFEMPYEEILYWRGVLYYKSGRLTIAKKMFLEVLKDWPQDEDCYSFLTSIYAEENKFDSACYYLRLSRAAGHKLNVDLRIVEKCQ